VSRDRFSENDIYPPPYGGGYYSRYQTGIELNYDFDFWNTKSSVVQAAKETKFAQMAYLEASKLALASAIAKSYISWNFDEKRLQTLNSMKFIFAEEYSILDAKFQRGLIDEVEINVQKSRISKINQQIFATKRLVESKKESICILAGFEPSVISTFHTPNIDENIKAPFPSTVYLDILSHRPDISIQKHIALSKSAKIDYAKSRFYPNINLSGLIGLVSLDQAKFLDASSSAPSAQLAISLPIFDWGERKAYLQGSVNDYESSVYDYNGAVVKAANEVVGTLKKSRLIDSQITYQNDELNSKVSNEKISQKRLVLGLAGRLPYLFAKADKSISILDKMALKEEEMMLQVDLIQALGGGYEDKQGNKDARK
jgi:outer membrane protein TolC